MEPRADSCSRLHPIPCLSQWDRLPHWAKPCNTKAAEPGHGAAPEAKLRPHY